MSVTVKICGLTTAEAAVAAVDAGADMVGLVIFEPSPRHLTFEMAEQFAAVVRDKTQIAVLTVDAQSELLEEINTRMQPDWYQLHGSESPEAADGIRQKFGKPVMKAVGVSVREDLAQLEAYQNKVDQFLLDAKPPKTANRPGGLGAVFDWQALEGLDQAYRFMLSGGLNVENVTEAILETRAAGVDVSSGVEATLGLKDPELIAKFVATARQADKQRKIVQ